jgi:multidrug efflux system membrane fusion protein
VNLYWKIAEPQVEQLPVGQPIKSKPHESIVKSSPVNSVKGFIDLKQFGVLGAALLAGIILWGCEANPAAVPKSNAIPVVVAKVSQKTMPVEVTSVGNVEAISTVSIKSQISGQLLEVHFKEGDFVHKDQLLFTIDPRPYQAQVAQVQSSIAKEEALLQQAEANLARDKVQLEYANSQAKRYVSLGQRGLIAADTSEQVRSQAAALEGSVQADEAAIQSARASLKAEQGALEGAKLQLSYCTIYSPIDGRTGAVMLKAGNLIKAADVPIVVINQVNPIYVNFTVPQQYWSDIVKHSSAGDLRVRATAAQDPNLAKEGHLTFVDNAMDATTGNLHIRAEFENSDNRFLAGMFVNVVLQLSEQPNANVVPMQAITESQNGTFVYVVKSDNTVEARAVVTSRSHEGEAVVDKGLNVDELVVTDGQTRLTPGAKVLIKNGKE